MAAWLSLDWHEMFVPSRPILEMIIRGSFTYLSVFVLLRLFRRQTGSLGPADLLVLLLIADASQNAMASEYKAITDGLILVATIIAWEYAIDVASYYFPAFGRLVERDPLLLIENGQIKHKNLRQELLTEEELECQLRQKGVADTGQVKQCFVEGDGHISVITNERSDPIQDQDRGPVA